MNKKLLTLLMILMAIYSIKAASLKIDCNDFFEDPVNVAATMSNEELEICADIYLDRLLASIERESHSSSSSSLEISDLKRSKPRRKPIKNKIF